MIEGEVSNTNYVALLAERSSSAKVEAAKNAAESKLLAANQAREDAEAAQKVAEGKLLAANQAREDAIQELTDLRSNNVVTKTEHEKAILEATSKLQIDLGHNLIINHKLLGNPVTQELLGMACNADKTPKDGGTLTVDELRDQGVDIVGECESVN